MHRYKKSKEETGYWKTMMGGDQRAFARIYELYFSMLYRYGRRICPETRHVEEGIHAIFVDLWRRRQTVSAPSSIRCYLYRSLRGWLEKEVPPNSTPSVTPLSPGQSEALVLYFEEEFSYGEIAWILDMNEQSAHHLVQRSLTALRNHYPNKTTTPTSTLHLAPSTLHPAPAPHLCTNSFTLSP